MVIGVVLGACDCRDWAGAIVAGAAAGSSGVRVVGVAGAAFITDD